MYLNLCGLLGVCGQGIQGYYFPVMTTSNLQQDPNAAEMRRAATDPELLLIGRLDCRQTPDSKEASMCQTGIISELCLGPHTNKKKSWLEKKSEEGSAEGQARFTRTGEETGQVAEPRPCHPPQNPGFPQGHPKTRQRATAIPSRPEKMPRSLIVPKTLEMPAGSSRNSTINSGTCI